MKTKTKKFEYKPRSMENVRSRSEQSSSSFDKLFKAGVRVYKLKEGINHIRILPPTWDDADHYGYDIFVHRDVGPDRNRYLCTGKMLGEDDPMDVERRSVRDDPEYAKSLEPQKRVIAWVIDRKRPEEGPMVLEMPWTLDRDIALQSADEATKEVYQIDHPDEGYDVTITRTGSDKMTKYTPKISHRSTPLSSNENDLEEWLTYIMENPLPEILEFKDYAYVERQFKGTSSSTPDSTADEDEDEVPARFARRTSVKVEEPEGEEELEEENEDVDDDGEEELEEEIVSKPATRASTITSRLRQVNRG